MAGADDLTGPLREQVRYWVEAGVRNVAVPTAKAPVPAQAQAEAARQRPPVSAQKPDRPPSQPATPRPEPIPMPSTSAQAAQVARPASVSNGPAEALNVIQADMDGCTRCGLAAGRTHLVFGVGDPNADIVFVGEAPGRDEDLQGIPFVGRAGQLLTDIIEKGMGIPRASVYICNTVKCRPPDNRNPLPEELASCKPFLARQLAAIRPKVIVALGKFAAQAVCRSEVPISRLRGNWHKYEDIDVMPTYHPAYLLRNPGAKREVWEDIRQVMARVGLPAKGRP